MDYLAARADWYWPVVQTGFIVGAVLWTVSLIVLVNSGRVSASPLLTLLATVDGAVVMQVLDGTWASVILLFHGAVLILVGAALVAGPSYQPWLPWVGLVAGLASAGVGFGLLLGILVPGRGGEWGFITRQ